MYSQSAEITNVETTRGKIILDEEIIRGSSTSGRAAHSELAQGQNIYGAGELAFAKNQDGKWITDADMRLIILFTTMKSSM